MGSATLVSFATPFLLGMCFAAEGLKDWIAASLFGTIMLSK